MPFLIAAIFIDALGLGIIYPVLAPVIAEDSLGLLAGTPLAQREVILGVILAAYALGMFFGAPVLGALSDRYGRKRILVTSLLGTAAGFLIGAGGLLAGSIAILLASRLIAGAFAGTLATAQAAMIDGVPPERRANALGLAMVANPVGFAVGPELGAILVGSGTTALAYSVPFVAVAVAAAADALLIQLFYRGAPALDPHRRVSPFAGISMVSEALRTPALTWLTIAFFCFGVGWTMFQNAIPVLLEERFRDGAAIGPLLSWSGLWFGIGVLVGIRVALRFVGIRQAAAIGLVVTGISAFFLDLATRDAVAFAIVVPWSLGGSVAYIAIATLYSQAVGPERQGQIMGLVGGVFALTWAIGPVVGGFLEGYGLLLPGLVGAALSLVGAALLLVRHRSPAEVAGVPAPAPAAA